MKLSMWIFADCLKEFHPKTEITSNAFEIETLRFYSPGQILNKNTLYIGTQDLLFHNESPHLFCQNQKDRIYLDTDDTQRVMNCIFETMERYSIWDNTMIELLSSTDIVQDLFDATEHMITQPVFLVDVMQRMQAHSRKYPMGTVDPQWDAMLRDGSCDIEYLKRINESNPGRFDLRGLYTYEEPLFDHPCYSYNFFVNNSWSGKVLILDLTGQITKGELDTFCMFCDYLNRWYQIHIQGQDSLVLDTLLMRAIKDPAANTTELQRKLTLLGWSQNDSLLFVKLDSPYLPFGINTYLCRTLNNSFSAQYAANAEASVCMLCNISKQPQTELIHRLVPLLNMNKCYGTTGIPFTIHNSVYENWNYVEQISENCPKEVGHIYDGMDYTMPYIMHKMQQTILPTVLHPALAYLRDYDSRHHSTLYDTLYAFLKNERSPLATARDTHLHRNTLAYRLNRLDEILPYDLDDFKTRMHILISFQIAEQEKYQKQCKEDDA